MKKRRQMKDRNLYTYETVISEQARDVLIEGCRDSVSRVQDGRLLPAGFPGEYPVILMLSDVTQGP